MPAIFAVVRGRAFHSEEAMPALARFVRQSGLSTTLFAAAVLTASCSGEEHRGSAGLQIRVSVEPGTPSVGSARITVHVSDQAWTPRNGLRVTVTSIRADAATVTETAVGEGAGRYVAGEFPFSAAGEWVLTARAELPDGRWTERDRVVAVLPPGP
jgi:hypothetical protein